VVLYDGASWQPWITDAPLGGNDAWAIQRDGSGTLWFVHGDGNGLSRYAPTNDTWQTFGDDEGALDWPSVPGVDGEGSAPPVGAEEADVGEIAQAPDGSLWVVAVGDLYHLDDGQWSRFSWPDGWIETMAIGPDGTVWVGSEGLGRFDPSNGGWQPPAPAAGLIERRVRAIHVTPAGVIWIGTKGEVSRYVPGE